MAEASVEGGGHLVVFYDLACPFCYLAEAVLDRLEAAGVTREYRAFELHPGVAPAAPPVGGPDDPWWAGTIEPLARALGAEIRRPSRAVATRKAHEAAAFAADAGRFDEMRRAIFRAYFLEDRDIGRVDVLVALGESLGLDATGLKVALDIDQYEDRLARAEAAARDAGVTGVPAFLAGGELLEGLQPPQPLLELARRGADGRQHEPRDTNG